MHHVQFRYVDLILVRQFFDNIPITEKRGIENTVGIGLGQRSDNGNILRPGYGNHARAVGLGQLFGGGNDAIRRRDRFGSL